MFNIMDFPDEILVHSSEAAWGLVDVEWDRPRHPCFEGSVQRSLSMETSTSNTNIAYLASSGRSFGA